MDKNKNTETASDNNYYVAIRNRLNQWLMNFQAQGYDIIFSKLADNMELLYGIKTTDQKLRAMFTPDSHRKIPLAEMVALCHMLHIPLNDICEFPNAPAAEPAPPWFKTLPSAQPVKGISALLNPHYYGDYYCYYFKPKFLSNTRLEGRKPSEAAPVSSAHLTIEEHNGIPTAVLRETSTDMDFYQQKELEQLELRGRIYLVEKTHQAYSLLMDTMGKRFICLMFDYHNYSKAIMYYRTAAMLTMSTNQNHAPLFQKMAMFRIPQDLSVPETNTMIRGTLTLNTSDIFIRQTDFDELASDCPDLLAIKPQETVCYHFNEQELLNRPLPWTFQERLERILLLRQKSTHAIHEIIAEDECFSDFYKTVQQALMQKSDN